MNSNVNRSIIIANIVIYILIFWFGPMLYPEDAMTGLYFKKVFELWGLLPSKFFSGYFWQPITAMFMHAGLLHIGVNMIALYSIGPPIEHTIGSKRYLQLYFISGLTGALFVILFQSGTTTPTVGASGAIMGILGALAVFYPNSYLFVFFIPMKARTAAILFAVGSVLFQVLGAAEEISHLGHLGGLIGGVLFSRFILKLSFFNSVLKEHPIDSIFQPDPFAEKNTPEFHSDEYEKVYYFDPETGRFVAEVRPKKHE
ncbi:MAG: rhomboid family intramembrane serine protease [Candidatus Hydrogenedentota bacterium]|nr:MAG: rhomboid family intramembrane serine protease [Candidatus Hydrogenedentota bacterium]